MGADDDNDVTIFTHQAAASRPGSRLAITRAEPQAAKSQHHGPAGPGLKGPGLAWLTALGRAGTTVALGGGAGLRQASTSIS